MNYYDASYVVKIMYGGRENTSVIYSFYEREREHRLLNESGQWTKKREYRDLVDKENNLKGHGSLLTLVSSAVVRVFRVSCIMRGVESIGFRSASKRSPRQGYGCQ